jgi:dTDP-4-amino-4,6-dideoxygalactose transaminase
MTSLASIPMVDLRKQNLAIADDIHDSINDVLQKTHFIGGENVRAFEQEAASYLGANHAISCANGTDALHLAMLAAGIGPGDEVITTPFTFIATVEAIAYVGATPVLVDVDRASYNIDPNLIEAAITDKTRAIVPVHLFGMPCDMQPINALANQYKLLVIEDCAQSFGATHDNQKTGTLGSIGCFSFFPSKNLGCFGDGGMLSCNDDDLAKKLQVLKSHGSAERYIHSVIGYNSRLDELQAAILRLKLKHIDHYNEERRRVAAHYCKCLADLPVELPQLTFAGAGDATPVFHQFTVLTEQRATIQEALQQNHIASAIYYPIPLHKQQAINGLLTSTPDCPVSETLSDQCMSLPIYPELDNQSIERIVGVVEDALRATA